MATIKPDLDSLSSLNEIAVVVETISRQRGQKRKVENLDYFDQSEDSQVLHYLWQGHHYAPSKRVSAWAKRIVLEAEKESDDHPLFASIFKKLLVIQGGVEKYLTGSTAVVFERVKLLRKHSILTAEAEEIHRKIGPIVRMICEQETSDKFQGSTLQTLLSIFPPDSEVASRAIKEYREANKQILSDKDLWADFPVDSLVTLWKDLGEEASRAKAHRTEFLERVGNTLGDVMRTKVKTMSLLEQVRALADPKSFGFPIPSTDQEEMAKFVVSSSEPFRQALDVISEARMRERSAALEAAFAEERAIFERRIRDQADALTSIENSLREAQIRLAKADLDDSATERRNEQLAARQAIGETLGFFRFLQEQQPELFRNYLARIDNLLKGMGVRRIGMQNDLLDFDPRAHEDTSGTAQSGQEVVVILNGFEIATSDKPEVLMKARVALI